MTAPVPAVDGSDVIGAARECDAVLRSAAGRQWDAPVPDLDWTVAQLVAHVAEGCLWYAIDLTAGGADLGPVQHRVEPDSAPADLLDTLTTYTRLLALAVDGAPPHSRGFHPWGAADASGFAAMACDELLIHTDDAARGLGLRFEPQRARCDRVLRRLFPWAPTDVDPWEALRWANGRIALGDRPRLQGWRWHCAPLEEWDGRPGTGDV